MIYLSENAAARKWICNKSYMVLIKKVRFFTCHKTFFTSFGHFVCFFRGLVLTSSSMMVMLRRRRIVVTFHPSQKLKTAACEEGQGLCTVLLTMVR